MDDLAMWEGVADDVLSATGCDDPPVDAYELAYCCGLRVIESDRCGAHLSEHTIYVPRRTRTVRRHGLVAHEVAHSVLVRADEDNTEDAARYTAGALLLPRQSFERDLRRTWNPLELQAKHINSSVELIARRIVCLRDAVASIWDNGRLAKRIASPWLPESLQRTSEIERRLASRIMETGLAEQPDELFWAVPVFDGRYRRVVIVAEAQQLSLRL